MVAGAVLFAAVSIAGTGAASAQEDDPADVQAIVADRSPDALTYSVCLPVEVTAEGSIGLRAAVEVTIDGRALPGVIEPVAVTPPARAPLCDGDAWVRVRLAVADMHPDPDTIGQPRRIELVFSMLDGPATGSTYEWWGYQTLTHGPPRGAIESVARTTQGFVVRGYVIDPENGAAPRIRLSVDGREPMSRSFQASSWSQLDDVRPWLPSWVAQSAQRLAGLRAEYGFSLTVPFGRVCLSTPDPRHGTDALSSALTLGCITSSIDGSRSVHVTQMAGLPNTIAGRTSVSMAGWISDPWATPTRVPSLRAVVLQTGQSIDITVDSALRSDFRALMTHVPTGDLTVCFYDTSTTAPEWWDRWHQRTEPLSCHQVHVPAGMPLPPTGTLDDVRVEGRRVTATGWALDPNGGSPRVLMWAGERMVAVVRPSIARPDVARALGGDGRAGFEMSADLPPGDHRLCFAYEDTESGGWTVGECRSVVVK